MFFTGLGVVFFWGMIDKSADCEQAWPAFVLEIIPGRVAFAALLRIVSKRKTKATRVVPPEVLAFYVYKDDRFFPSYRILRGPGALVLRL